MKKGYIYDWAVDITQFREDGTHFISETEVFPDQQEALEFREEFNEHHNQDPLLYFKQAEKPRKVVA